MDGERMRAMSADQKRLIDVSCLGWAGNECAEELLYE
jgi:hypothetical protein